MTDKSSINPYYIPVVYQFNDPKKDILTTDPNIISSVHVSYPKMYLGFQHFIHQSKLKMEITKEVSNQLRKIWRDNEAHPQKSLEEAYTLGQQGRWINVEDRLPENGRDVLVADKESDIVCTAWYSAFEECFNRQVAGINITHWSELPTPPKI